MIVALLAASTWREWAFAAMVLLLLMALMLVARHIEHLALKAQDQRREEEAAAVAAERRRRFLPKRGYTEQEMRLFNGADRDLPIALACAGKGARRDESAHCALPKHASSSRLPQSRLAQSCCVSHEAE